MSSEAEPISLKPAALPCSPPASRSTAVAIDAERGVEFGDAAQSIGDAVERVVELAADDAGLPAEGGLVGNRACRSARRLHHPDAGDGHDLSSDPLDGDQPGRVADVVVGGDGDTVGSR